MWKNDEGSTQGLTRFGRWTADNGKVGIFVFRLTLPLYLAWGVATGLVVGWKEFVEELWYLQRIQDD